MKIRSILDLQDFLDKDFGWRLKEIAELKASVQNSGSIAQSTIIRAGIPLLYAHWEGFVKNAANAYIEFVSRKSLPLEKLSTNFIFLGLRKHLKGFSDRIAIHRGIEIVNFIKFRPLDQPELKFDGAITARSNLNSEVFKEIALTIGIDLDKYQSWYNWIDFTLLQRRNNIAHGLFLGVDFRSYITLSDEVIDILRKFKTDIENSASTDKFLRNLAID